MGAKLTLSSVVLGSMLLIAGNSYADDDKKSKVTYLDNCEYLPLVNNPQNPANQSVCVDAPVALTKVKVIFDMTQGVAPGKEHTGLRHMGMLAQALMGRIKQGLIEPEDISIIGVIHSSTAVRELATVHSSDITKSLIDTIFQFKNAGVNINLEICGVTLHGMREAVIASGGNPDVALKLYENLGNIIHINQGAIGRMIDLQQKKYTLIKE